MEDQQEAIEAVLSAYDDLIENNRHRIVLLEEAARLLYREWFVHARFPGHEHVRITDGLPESWERRTLGSVLMLHGGFDLPVASRTNGDIPVYGTTGVVGSHDQPRVATTTVITGRAGSLGRLFYVDEPCWPLNTCLWVKEFLGISPCFAYFLLESMNLSRFNSGACIATLDRKVVHAAHVVVPNAALISLFDDHVRTLFGQRKVLEQQNQKLAEARKLLLPRLMNGEIAVRF
jgi:type I restriction enzyme S subunit